MENIKAVRTLRVQKDASGNNYIAAIGVDTGFVTVTETEEQRRIAALEEQVSCLEKQLTEFRMSVSCDINQLTASQQINC
ncbi:hypothetical protein VSX61_22130 [Brenneria populi subsp. brevivirga]|uniref:hypothetical protein n=1 Tax=Brenneria populi TaxID=1505588 RepID=UPI002E16C15B|nr:hypothetical protein [Brenneria populi subsp. brevivirga]